MFVDLWFCGCVVLCRCGFMEMFVYGFMEMWFCANFIVNKKHEEHGYYLCVLRVAHGLSVIIR